MLPIGFADIQRDSEAFGFTMRSDVLTGSLLRTLARTKTGGSFLEIGTGTGLGTAWLLDGMDHTSRLITVDNEPDVVAIAQKHLGQDRRVAFVVQDGVQWLEEMQTADPFDFIFADAMPGKYEHFDLAWNLLKPGGIYIIDDMLPQPNWPAGHASKVTKLMQQLNTMPTAFVTEMNWATGVILVVKR